MTKFIEQEIDGNLIRHWDESADSDDFYWHRDHENRTVQILSCGADWKFQFDNELPFTIEKGTLLKINKEQWHRIIKGQGSLSVFIIKNS